MASIPLIFNVVEQVQGKVVRSGRVPTVFKADGRSLVQLSGSGHNRSGRPVQHVIHRADC